MTAIRPAFILGDRGSTDSEMSQLRRGDFVGFAAVQILRIKAGHDRLCVMFRDDVHRQ